MSFNVDKRVINKIHGLVANGVRGVAEMRRHITAFSKDNFSDVSESNNKFFPNNKSIRNHIYAALNLSRYGFITLVYLFIMVTAIAIFSTVMLSKVAIFFLSAIF